MESAVSARFGGDAALAHLRCRFRNRTWQSSQSHDLDWVRSQTLASWVSELLQEGHVELERIVSGRLLTLDITCLIGPLRIC